MSLDLENLRAAVARHGRLARVVVLETRGSAPREAGAAMLIWPGGQSGSIGGGTLELEAGRRALQALAGGEGDWLETLPLGPDLGQCCGGTVRLLCEVFDAARLGEITGPVWLRRAPGGSDGGAGRGGGGDVPLRIRRALAEHRRAGQPFAPICAGGWVAECLSRPMRHVWLFGAGHVGRAVVDVLAPLPDVRISWIDSAEVRFPGTIPDGVRPLVRPNPADAVAEAPPGAEHLIFTFSHAIDLEICHRLLGHGFGWAGLIGSASKWARFRKRLLALGHAPEAVERIACPIGDPALGKHPQAIAVGVVARMLARWQGADAAGGEEQTGGWKTG